MSLYIHQENQKLIWDSIHKLPRFQEFAKNEPGKQEALFREIIQQFYESNKFKLLSIEELQQLNMEFAVEAKKLVAISLAGRVG